MKLEEAFAKNLKNLRKKQNLTQSELAVKIGCSEKAVSKWECALSIPDIEILFLVAKTFCTNVETLFSSDEEVYLLGIDGGGTKTHLALAKSDGKIIRESFADCCNPIDIGIERAMQVLSEAIFDICADIPFCSILCFAGISGGTSADMKRALSEFFTRFGFLAFKSDSDNKNIVAAGLGERDGITLILGTGVCSFLQKDGECSHVGGSGYLIDDGGSGYNIGRDALSAYYRSIDGMVKPTLITKIINEMMDCTPQTLLGRVYSEGKKFIASLSVFVYEAAHKGDEVALDIIKRNMQQAAAFVLANAKKLDTSCVSLVIAGGLTKDELTMQYLTEALGTEIEFDIKVLDCAPVYGALRLAKKLYKEKENKI